MTIDEKSLNLVCFLGMIEAIKDKNSAITKIQLRLIDEQLYFLKEQFIKLKGEKTLISALIIIQEELCD